MSMSKNIHAYEDCRAVMVAALENNGCEVEFDSRGKALNFRQRCYAYRRLLKESLGDTETPYCKMKIPTPVGTVVTLRFAILPLTVRTLTGKPITLQDDGPTIKSAGGSQSDDDPLLTFALNLKQGKPNT